MERPQPFARFFKWIRRCQRSRPSRPAEFVRIGLERLEERCVTAVVTGMEGPEGFPQTNTAWEGLAWRPQEAARPLADQSGTGALHEESGQVWHSLLTHPWPTSDENRVSVNGVDAGFHSSSIWPGGSDHASGLKPDPLISADDPSAALGGAAPSDSLPGSTGASPLFSDHSSGDKLTPGVVTSDPMSTPGSVTQDSSTPPNNLVPQVDSGLNPVITPTLTAVRNVASVACLHDTQSNVFRITRTPVSDTNLEVPYTLTAFSSASIVGQDRSVTIPPGEASVDVSLDLMGLGKVQAQEIVTITLRNKGDHEIALPSATLFVAGNARCCSEPALLEAYRQGKSTEAFSTLVERYQPTVLRTSYRIVGNWHDAEDVTQMVFLALGHQQVRLQTTLAGWLNTVARNASIALLRAKSRRSRHELSAARPLMVGAEDSSHDLREELDAALKQLSSPLREAVQLRYIEGWSQTEAAQIVGCPRGTLSQRAALGVSRLRNILSNDSNRADNE